MATTTTLPRPSRPPTTPLPSLPVSKSRKSSVSSIHTAPSQGRRGSAASITVPSAPKPSASRSVSSGIPTRPPKNASTPAIPTVNGASKPPSASTTTPSGTATPGRSLRQTVSIGAFPQPPRNAQRSTSHPPSPLSHSATNASGDTLKTLRTPSGTHTSRVVPPRTSSKPHPRVSLRKSSSTTSAVSLLSGGEYRSINSATLLSLPTSPLSRASSVDNLSSITFEDDDDFGRGRDLMRGSKEDMAYGSGKSVEGGRRHSEKDGGKGNVLVSVRVRPDVGHDGQKSELEWMVDGRRSLISYRGREGGEYYYDNVFAAHDQNAKVYDSAAKRLVRRVMEGYHGTVFAYGMTGTGKTFSMQGTATSPGVIPLAITDIFSFIRETPHREFLLRVSYLEIYNEKIHDLLSTPAAGVNGMTGGPQEEIKLREDSKRGVYATPLKEEIVQSPTQLLRVIARGDNSRRTGSTQYNARSSRSHAVVQIVVESRERSSPPGASAPGADKRTGIAPGGVRVSTLSLIDLAGSERAAENKERRTEGAHINKSLLTLGTVIGRLSGDKDGDKKGDGKEKDGKDGLKHLPYRDSKLTRLLQPALSGNSLVSILCTIQIGSAGSVASAQNHTGETLNTLKFASRAKNNIVSHAKKAEEALAGDATSRALLDRYRVEILELRRQLEGQKDVSSKGGASGAIGEPDHDPESAALDAEEERERKAKEEEEMQARHEEQMLEMQLARTALKERIEHLNRLILSSKSIGVNHTHNMTVPRSVSALGNRPTAHSSRQSLMSAADLQLPLSRQASTTSARSASTTTLDANGAPHPPTALRRTESGSASLRSLQRHTSASRLSTASTPATHGVHPSPALNFAASDADSTDSLGSNGDGTASLSTQLHALRADVADKNRYINTLERRLLQARRSSSSRISSGFFGGPSGAGTSFCVACRESAAKDGKDGAGVEVVFQEKDREISELRGRVGDLERMCQALRSRLRLGDLKVDTGNGVGLGLNVGGSPASRTVSPILVNKRASVRSQSSGGSGGSAGSAAALNAAGPVATNEAGPVAPNGVKHTPVALLNGGTEKETTEGEERRRGVEEMTRLLDQMITERSRMSFAGGVLNIDGDEKAEGGAVGGAVGGVVGGPALGTTEEEEVRVDSGIVVGK
ncbi:kinesin-domain-containing protein [Eremomyces bilateralis CBS 781.70]|uniref:Kinesin-like protein KIP2 n=1 Tax=Eremomyces bilateralis CBS 781.70 TaxID=1392243 RepID=A0A6G1GCB3_9PEZI|nr:kinesin-domain-containing protein [Eremomyces bilateralis CBS 781.70]KAF1815489.1 kinesin-domain-containing protein [Eremomyces bilateralis CBS 781.70]